MSIVNELLGAPGSDEAHLLDRRRSGRLDYDNPNLIDMLRRPDAPAFVQAAAENDDPIVAFYPTPLQRSAFPAVIVLTALFWAGLAAVVWRML